MRNTTSWRPSVCDPSFLTEDDIPGSSLNGGDPNRLKGFILNT